MKTYRISSSGRRTALILLVGALIIWAFALWTLQSTLAAGAGPQDTFWSALSANIERGFTISQMTPALLMLVLIVATPLVVWNILEEWDATYTPAEDGLRFASLGIVLLYPWAGIIAIQRMDGDSDEPIDELVLAQDYSSQIRNPLLRFLHVQAYGRLRLPLYAGLADREELLAEIQRRTGLPTEGPAPAPAQ